MGSSSGAFMPFSTLNQPLKYSRQQSQPTSLFDTTQNGPDQAPSLTFTLISLPLLQTSCLDTILFLLTAGPSAASSSLG